MAIKKFAGVSEELCAQIHEVTKTIKAAEKAYWAANLPEDKQKHMLEVFHGTAIADRVFMAAAKQVNFNRSLVMPFQKLYNSLQAKFKSVDFDFHHANKAFGMQTFTMVAADFK